MVAPTCFVSAANRLRRIDVMLGPPALQVLVGSPVLDWTTGVHTHAYHQLTLDIGKQGQVPCWVKGKQLPGPVGGGPSRQEAWGEVPGEVLRDFEVALSRKDVEGCWRAVSEAAVSYAASRSGGQSLEKELGKVVMSEGFSMLPGRGGEASRGDPRPLCGQIQGT